MPLHAFRPASCVFFLSLCCAVAAAETGRTFAVQGVVRGTYQEREGTISIQHEEIPGFMPAMTMPFYVDAAEGRRLAPGDRVAFEFRVGERSRATHFRKLGRESTAPAKSTAAGTSTATRRLREGDAVPPFALVDHNNQPLTADALEGRHTVLTFVFTRCPVPEFCPLIGKKYQALQKALGATANLPTADVQLLSISIDPEHDTPAVLRTYGESLGADFAKWRFGTGIPSEVEKLTRAFAVRTERNGGSLDHTLATALIGPDGRVIEIWRGNGWKPEQIIARLAQPLGQN